MKKLLLLLLASLWLCASPLPAKATVSCSVPFNLTNGTVADATQVMADFNAILTCLSSSAAKSGANSDITSLTGLTTPLTPAQGGATALCGATNFKVVRASGTTLTITYTQALVTNSLNAVQFGTSGSLTLNAGTTGANGLDTGSLTASGFVYLYLIGNGSVIASLGSASSTAPVLPSGYTYSCRLAAWETGTTSQFLTLQTNGSRTQLMQLSGGGGSNIAASALAITASSGTCTTATALALTTFAGIPPTAVRAFGIVGYNSNSEAYVSSYQNALSANDFAPGEEGTVGVASSVQFDIALPSPQQFYTCIVTTGVITVGGWVDSVNAN